MRVLNTWTGGYPIGFHLNGTWESCKDATSVFTPEFFRDLYSSHNPQPLNDVTILYMWFDPKDTPDTYVMQDQIMCDRVLTKELLLSNLVSWGIEGVNLCEGWDWRQYDKPVAMKPHLLVQHLHSITTTYVIGWDVDTFFTEHPNEVVRRFEYMECDWLFNASATVHPFSLKKFYDDWQEHWDMLIEVAQQGSVPWRFLNSGLWIARTDFLREITDDLIMTKLWDDDFGEQGHITHVYKKHFGRIRQDLRCEIFQSMGSAPEGCLKLVP